MRGLVTHGPEDRLRIGLVATQALLLGGDEVDVEVEVGPDVRLDLFDVAGTVAYGGGGPARWRVAVSVADRGRLAWTGAPFVVADGSDVARSLDVELASTALIVVRETLVLGRAGEVGGDLRARTRIVVHGTEVLVEDLRLDRITRVLPGVLGGHRVLDSLLTVGEPPGPAPGAGVRLRLADGGTLDRWLGVDLSRSPLAASPTSGRSAPFSLAAHPM